MCLASVVNSFEKHRGVYDPIETIDLPVYLTDATVDTVMKGLPNDDAAKRTSAKSLRALVHKRLTINSVYSIKQEYIKVKKGRGENIVTIEYEPRGTLVGSLDYIVTFKHEARIKTK